jgi:hypothetical protein
MRIEKLMNINAMLLNVSRFPRLTMTIDPDLGSNMAQVREKLSSLSSGHLLLFTYSQIGAMAA